MRFREISEGGWDTTVTQSTVINPRIVSTTLSQVDRFVKDFNRWLESKNLDPVKLGRPTGSASYYERDMKHDPEKIYGDVDLQMIAPPFQGLSYGQYTAKWNGLADEFVKSVRPDYVHPTESKAGHPIFKIGKDAFVQVDFMWHEPALQQWGATRVTPEHNVKGLLTGNMYSVLGELLDMSIQHAGVQYKVQDGVHVPFSKQKDVEIKTISINPKTFVLDILKHFAKSANKKSLEIDPMLSQHSGVNPENVKIQDMVLAVKGLADSFEANGLFGIGVLSRYNDAREFEDAFIRRYEEKAMADVTAKKREKANTPEAKARAEADKKKVLNGLEMVKNLFHSAKK